MKALRISDASRAQLAVDESPVPALAPTHALVRVRAAGLNRADVLQLHGKYPVPADAPIDIPGLEFAGTVDVLGHECSRFAKGQRVFGLCSGGAQAQYVAVPETLLMTTPDNLTDVQAAAIPEAFVTAHDALVTQARLAEHERVLVHAAGSGVGLAAMQVAALWGCEFFGTVRHKHKLNLLRQLPIVMRLIGGDARTHFILPEKFDNELLTITGGQAMNVILDPVGAAYFERNLRVLASKGRLVVIATMGGTMAMLDLSALMRKRVRLIGTVLRSRSLLEKVEASRAFERDLLAALASGKLEPVIDSTFTLTDAAAAYARMEANKNIGKIVITMPD